MDFESPLLLLLYVADTEGNIFVKYVHDERIGFYMVGNEGKQSNGRIILRLLQ